MTDYLDKVKTKRTVGSEKELEDARFQAIVDAVKESDSKLSQTIKELAVSALMTKDPEVAKVAKLLATLLKQTVESVENIKLGVPLSKDDRLALSEALQTIHETVLGNDVTKLIPYLERLEKASQKEQTIEVNPEVDLAPLLSKLDELKAESPTFDNTDVLSGLQAVETQLKRLYEKPQAVPEFPTTIKVSDSSGNDILDPTQGFAPSDVDEASDPKYYGFLKADGRWYIMKNSSDTTFRYCVGESGYSTAWTDRASQTYDYFSEVF